MPPLGSGPLSLIERRRWRENVPLLSMSTTAALAAADVTAPAAAAAEGADVVGVLAIRTR